MKDEGTRERRKRRKKEGGGKNKGGEENERGREGGMLEDCTGETDYGDDQSAIKMVKMQGGVFGTVSNSEALIDALNA